MPEPAIIDFWFDAVCPWTWRTANWLRTAAAARDVEVRWRPMSLYKLNQGSLPQEHREGLERSRSLMRVLAAVEAAGGGRALESGYFAAGRRIHDEGRDVSAPLLAEVVEEAGVTPDTAAAGDDPSWDETVYRSHAEGQAAMGEDSGSPILRPEGCRAVFGPVLNSSPDAEDGLRLFDGILATAATAEFAEMKRPRG